MWRLLFLVVLISACSSGGNSPEDQIKAVINQVEESAEARNRSAISEHISPRFQGPHGEGLKEVNNLLRAYLLRNKDINIFTTIHSYDQVSPQEYTVKLTAAMAAKGVDLSSESARLKADLHHFTVTFVDVSGKGEWQIEKALWERGL